MPTIDEIISMIEIDTNSNYDHLRAAIESAIREVQDAAKDCRTCGKARKSGHQCGSTAACIDGDQYQPTQPVRLWEK